jgi:glutamyl-tRNA synthetase
MITTVIVTHIIRGDDHLSNAAKQKLIYQAMDWRIPIFAHIPLIFGEDGKKLSKRHGATGTIEYQKLGYTPAGMRNYLARLGWSHRDDEFFNTTQAISWFDLKGINKSPARFDFKKLDSINGKHIATLDDNDLIKNLKEFTKLNDDYDLTKLQISKISKALYCLKTNQKKFQISSKKLIFYLQSVP